MKYKIWLEGESVTDREFEKCVKKILKNEKDGLREIYDQYRVYIYSCMWKIVQNKENAEDLTADFFIKFWETADKYKFGGKHRAWLATIARNMAIDFVRKNKKMILSDEMPETGDSNTSGMEELVVGNMFLKEALETLNEGEQEVVHLKIVAELTFKEIAKVLKLPMGTITWRYQNAIKKLRRCGYE